MENIKKKLKETILQMVGGVMLPLGGCRQKLLWKYLLCDSSDRLHISQHTIVHDYFMVKCVLLGVSSLKMYSCPIVFI